MRLLYELVPVYQKKSTFEHHQSSSKLAKCRKYRRWATHTHTQHISQNGNRTIPSSHTHTHTRVNRPNILLNESQKYFLTRIFSLFDPFLAMWISNHISYYILFSVKICSFWITDIFINELQNGYIEWIVCTMRIDCLGKMTVCFISFNSCRNGMREKITYAHTHTHPNGERMQYVAITSTILKLTDCFWLTLMCDIFTLWNK